MSLVKQEVQEFYDLLVNYDWTHEYSDDHRAWTKGRQQKQQIVDAMQSFPELEAIYQAFERDIFRTS
jgi:hypothetical protein